MLNLLYRTTQDHLKTLLFSLISIEKSNFPTPKKKKVIPPKEKKNYYYFDDMETF